MVIALMLGAFAVSGITVVAMRSRRIVIPRPRRPSAPLRVVFAPDAIMYRPALVEALSAWYAHMPGVFVEGHPVRGEALPGCVYVRMATVAELPDKTLARTYVTPFHGDILMATIAIGRLEPWAAALPLAHELGQAAGFTHPRWAPKGLLMNGKASRIGWSFRGMEG